MSPEPARAEPAPTPSEAERTATLERAASDPRTLW